MAPLLLKQGSRYGDTMNRLNRKLEKNKSDSKIENIEDVWKRGLCCGCGTCVGVCPYDAIKICLEPKKGIFVPQTSSDCKNCNICVNACPGYSLDFDELNEFIFGRVPDDILLGNYINCYIGHSLDNRIRWNATSGGLVTSLLIFALEEGIIDGALVMRMNQKKPLEPEVIIAQTSEEIVSALGPKYCPVPLNVGIKEILNRNGKFMVVGLPCHIHGIRKAEMVNKKLKERIFLHLGLFCHHGVNFLGTDFLCQMINVRKGDIEKIAYRGKGWPGSMSVELKNGEKRLIPWPNCWSHLVFDLHFFTPKRCTLCSDGTNELADISFGDPWLPEIRDKIGKSIIISRSKTGEEFLQKAKSKRKIEISPCNSDKVIQSQGAMIQFKKKNLKARLFLLKTLGRSVPTNNARLLKPRLTAYLLSPLTYLCIRISQKRSLWPLLRMISLKLYDLIRYLWNLLQWETR